jgi:hypothetical protein
MDGASTSPEWPAWVLFLYSFAHLHKREILMAPTLENWALIAPSPWPILHGFLLQVKISVPMQLLLLFPAVEMPSSARMFARWQWLKTISALLSGSRVKCSVLHLHRSSLLLWR